MQGLRVVADISRSRVRLPEEEDAGSSTSGRTAGRSRRWRGAGDHRLVLRASPPSSWRSSEPSRRPWSHALTGSSDSIFGCEMRWRRHGDALEEEGRPELDGANRRHRFGGFLLVYGSPWGLRNGGSMPWRRCRRRSWCRCGGRRREGSPEPDGICRRWKGNGRFGLEVGWCS
jgi:hypothetical protein